MFQSARDAALMSRCCVFHLPYINNEISELCRHWKKRAFLLLPALRCSSSLQNCRIHELTGTRECDRTHTKKNQTAAALKTKISWIVDVDISSSIDEMDWGGEEKKRNWNLIQNRYSTERALNMLQMKRIGSQLQFPFSIKSRCIFNDFSWFLALTLSLWHDLCVMCDDGDHDWKLKIHENFTLSLCVLFGDAIRLPTDSLHHHPQNRQQPTSESRNISNFYCSSPPSFGPVYLLFVFLAQFILPIVSHLSLFSHSIQEPNNPQFQCTTNSISRLKFL